MKKLYVLSLLTLYSVILNSQTTQLTVRGFAEGYYRPQTGMMIAVLDPVNQPLVCDSALVELIDTVTMQSAVCLEDVVSVDGYINVTVPSTFNGNHYFVSMKFRNTFHLLTTDPVLINGTPLSVDLTDIQNTCCNFDTTYGVARAYSGDVNNDGTLDGGDFLLIDADMQNQVTGYTITDLTGDRKVDTSDFNLFNVNLNAGWSDDYVGGCSTIGVDELNDFVAKVYPNPCNDILTISMERYNAEIRISLFDVLGKTCIEEKFFSEKEVKINTQKLPPGIYFLRLETGQSVFSEKVIKN